MWELDHKESLALKTWCFWTLVLEKTLESPLDCKEIQTVYLKGNKSWMFTERTDAEAETPTLWPPDRKNWLLGKDSDSGKIEGGRRRDDRWWDDWMASLTQWAYVWVSSRSWWWTGKAWRAAVYGVAKSHPRLSDWTQPTLPQRLLLADTSLGKQTKDYPSGALRWDSLG